MLEDLMGNSLMSDLQCLVRSANDAVVFLNVEARAPNDAPGTGSCKAAPTREQPQTLPTFTATSALALQDSEHISHIIIDILQGSCLNYQT